jgi:Beta xylosidase C-terminal Concanavalin A-like domain
MQAEVVDRKLADDARPWIIDGDDVDFASGESLPAHFTYWRFPSEGHFTISSTGYDNSLRLRPSTLNLTGLNGNYAGPSGLAFVGRRQQDTLFTYSVQMSFSPTTLGEEAGVTAFLVQNHHLDLGIVMLPSNATNSTTLAPHFRFRGISYVQVPEPVIAPVPEAWIGRPLRLEIRASNMTHYSFSAGPADAPSESRTVITVPNDAVSWGFTGKCSRERCVSFQNVRSLTA